MFCPKCGKEIGEGLRFCGACGFDTAAVQQAVAAPQQTEQGQQATAQEQQATQGQQTANTLSPEQTAKFQAAYAEAESNLVKLENQSNTLALIGKIILVVTEAILLFKVIPNEKNFIGVLAVAVFGLIPFYCYVYFVRAGISIKKRKVVGAYVDALTGRSLKEIADMWKTSACPDIKDVNYNPYQNIVTIHSKLWGEAEVKQQEGHTTLTWLKGKDNGFAQSTLAAYLVKQINPTLKLDARKVYKNNKFWKHVEWICGWLILGAFMIAFGMVIMGAFGGQKYIGAVRDNKPEGYNITYGDAFDKVFDKGEWNYHEADDGKVYVDYIGKVNGRTIGFQWQLTLLKNDMAQAELYAIEVDGEPVSKFEGLLLLTAIMEGTSFTDELNEFGALFDNEEMVKNDNSRSLESQITESQSAANAKSNADADTLPFSQTKGAEQENNGYGNLYGNPYENLEGDWTDMGRCHIHMERSGDISYHVTIQWGSSAWESSCWEMDAWYVPEEDGLYFENAFHWDEIYDDNGNVNYNPVYADGAGWFDVYDDVLYWTSFEDVDGIDGYSFYRE